MREGELPSHEDDASAADVRRLLEARAERLRAQPATPEEEQVAWLAAFAIGGERWAFPLDSVRSVLKLRHVTPVPLGPPALVGVARIEGEVVPVWSLAALLGGRTWRSDARFLVVLQSRGRVFVVDSEQVPMATTVSMRALAEGEQRPDGLAREVRTPSEVVRVVDVEALVARGDGG